MTRTLDLLAAAVAPDRCLHCRGPAGRGALLCPVCRRALPWLGTDGCPRCALPRPCARGRCPAAGASFARAWAPLAYEGPARSLVLQAKERAARRATPWLAATMTARAPAGLLAGVGTVVPVPADPARARRRGEDHAALLAAAVAARIGCPVDRPLVRRRAAPAQHEQGRAARRRLAAPEAVAPASGTVLLVDDVHTTGATLRGASAALRSAGARRVVVLTALRTLR